MAIRERLVYAIDIVTDGASKGLKSFKSSVAEAEGSMGKLRAGASSAFGTIRANAGLATAALGGALLTAGVNAVKQFDNLALSVEKFSKATGTSAEEASRWIEVAGDIGISTESIQGGFVKLEKAIATAGPAVKDLGLELQRNADGTANVSETMLKAIEALEGIEDPTLKAKAATELFGRGYAEMAELVVGDSARIKAALAGVSGAKIIDEGEIAKAKRNRENLDRMRDTVENLAITLGSELGPALEGAADGVESLDTAIRTLKVDKLIELTGKFDDLGSTIGHFFGDLAFGPDVREANAAIVNALQASQSAAEEFDRSLIAGLPTFAAVRQKVVDLTGDVTAANIVALEWKQTQEDLPSAIDDTGGAVADLGDKAANTGIKIGDLSGALEGAEEHLAGLNQEARDNALGFLADAARGVAGALDEAFGGLEDDLSSLDLLDDIQDQFIAIAEAQKEATDPQGVRNYNREVRRLQGMLLDYLQTVDDIPPDKVTEIIAKIRSGDIDVLKATLDELTKDRFINITPVVLHDAFHSVGGTFSPTQATPTFQGVTSAPNAPVSTDARTIINYYPVGTTPTTQYQNEQTDLRRNGPR